MANGASSQPQKQPYLDNASWHICSRAQAWQEHGCAHGCRPPQLKQLRKLRLPEHARCVSCYIESGTRECVTIKLPACDPVPMLLLSALQSPSRLLTILRRKGLLKRRLLEGGQKSIKDQHLHVGAFQFAWPPPPPLFQLSPDQLRAFSCERLHFPCPRKK